MKNLKLFLMAIASIALVTLSSCGGNENEPDPQPENKAAMVVKYGEQELKSGDVVVINEVDDIMMEIVAHLFITNTTSNASEFTLKEVRHFDENTLGSALCIDLCTPGSTDAEQVWKLGAIESNSTLEAQYHLMVKDTKAHLDSSADITISNGTDNFNFTLKFQLN